MTLNFENLKKLDLKNGKIRYYKIFQKYISMNSEIYKKLLPECIRTQRNKIAYISLKKNNKNLITRSIYYNHGIYCSVTRCVLINKEHSYFSNKFYFSLLNVFCPFRLRMHQSFIIETTLF